jgi:large subunit ribosomal protein L22
MQVSATLKYVRMSPRKVRLVVDLVRGKPVNEALALLRFTPKSAAKALDKVVRSAIANAENNYTLDAEDLYIARISADTGPTLKRFRPRAHGRVSPLLKRSTNITVVLDERNPVGGQQVGR